MELFYFFSHQFSGLLFSKQKIVFEWIFFVLMISIVVNAKINFFSQQPNLHKVLTTLYSGQKLDKSPTNQKFCRKSLLRKTSTIRTWNQLQYRSLWMSSGNKHPQRPWFQTEQPGIKTPRLQWVGSWYSHHPSSPSQITGWNRSGQTLKSKKLRKQTKPDLMLSETRQCWCYKCWISYQKG